jgi:hypothetical protein
VRAVYVCVPAALNPSEAHAPPLHFHPSHLPMHTSGFPGCPFAPLPLSRSSLADSGQPLRGAACHGRHQVWVQFPGLRPAARQVVRQDWVTTIALEHECPLNRSMNKPPSTHVLRTLQPVKEQPQLAPHNQHIFFTGRWVPVPYHRVVVPYSPTMVSRPSPNSACPSARSPQGTS